MLPETSTALSAASRLKTSSPRPEKIGLVSKTLTMDIRRTGLPRHSAHAREGRFGQPGTLAATWRTSGIGAQLTLSESRLSDGFAPIPDLPALTPERAGSVRTELLRMLISSSRQFVEQRLRFFQVGAEAGLVKKKPSPA